MDRVRNLLEQIQGRLDSLNKAERKVAEVILHNPQQATRFSIAALAQAAQVSEPTVNRFCRSFGVNGYPELKMQLAQSLASGAAYVSQAVSADDGPEAYTRKIFGSAIASLDSACQSLDPNLISRAVDLLIQARQIHFFGLGASAPVALDAQHKFFRFNLAVSAHADVLMQRMLASVAHTGDLFVIISYTGRTRELVEVARLARAAASLSTKTASAAPRESAPVTTTTGESGFVAIEIKYSESMLEPLAQIKPRYDELSAASQVFTDPTAQALREAPLQQLWREHLLSRVMVDNGLYGQGRFVVIHPAQNANCASAVRAYRRHLVSTDPEVSGFQAISLEDCLTTLADIGDQETASALRARYLDFARIDRAIFGE